MTRLPIAAVQGEGPGIQRLFTEVLSARWRPGRIAGVIQVGAAEMGGGDEPGVCGREVLRSIGDGREFPLFQDLGLGSTACAIDPAGVSDACAAVCRDIAVGCDLVVLSKFGKLEAESGSGLMAAFGAALESGIPILTAVPPRIQPLWDEFAAPYYQAVAPNLAEIAAWWAAQSVAAASSASR